MNTHHLETLPSKRASSCLSYAEANMLVPSPYYDRGGYAVDKE